MQTGFSCQSEKVSPDDMTEWPHLLFCGLMITNKDLNHALNSLSDMDLKSSERHMANPIHMVMFWVSNLLQSSTNPKKK